MESKRFVKRPSTLPYVKAHRVQIKILMVSARAEGALMFFDDHRETHLIIHFDPTVRNRYIPVVRDYCDVLRNQVLPIFDEIQESNAPLHEKILGFWRYNEGRKLLIDDKEEQVAHSGYWGIGVDDWNISDMQTVFLAIGITGLFHLFEKQIYRFVNEQLQVWLRSPIFHWRDLETLLVKFDKKAQVSDRCTELIDAFINQQLVELVWVANAIKHGGGPAYNKLVENKSAVVSERRFLKSGTVLILDAPLSVRADDLLRYQDAITKFWMLEGPFYAPPNLFKGVRPSPDWSTCR